MALADDSMQAPVQFLAATIWAQTYGQTKMYNSGQRQNKTHVDQCT